MGDRHFRITLSVDDMRGLNDMLPRYLSFFFISSSVA